MCFPGALLYTVSLRSYRVRGRTHSGMSLPSIAIHALCLKKRSSIDTWFETESTEHRGYHGLEDSVGSSIRSSLGAERARLGFRENAGSLMGSGSRV